MCCDTDQEQKKTYQIPELLQGSKVPSKKLCPDRPRPEFRPPDRGYPVSALAGRLCGFPERIPSPPLCYRDEDGEKNILAINDPSKEALEFYRRSLDSFDRNNYIFASQKAPHNRICRSQAFRIIKKAAVYCGLEEHISCHSLRKTFGYYAWQNGTPPAMLMNIYNHSSYEITKRYLGIEQTEKDEVFLNTFL